jgi:TnpA family transposase
MVKSTVAVKRGTATSEAILKRYNSYNVTHPTYKAFAEVGKAEKTIFFCDYLASREVQREVHEGLNVVENWNATNDFICYGRQGELATNSREQQEVITLSLRILQSCLMLINTLLVERTIEREGLWEKLTTEDLGVDAAVPRAHQSVWAICARPRAPFIPGGCVTNRLSIRPAHLPDAYWVLSQLPLCSP